MEIQETSDTEKILALLNDGPKSPTDLLKIKILEWLMMHTQHEMLWCYIISYMQTVGLSRHMHVLRNWLLNFLVSTYGLKKF